MRVVPLEQLPNQSLSINVDGNRWDLRIKVATNSMVIDISLNDQVIILGQRITVGWPVIPYDYLATEGNFIFLTENEEMPDWNMFGITQQLLYVSPGELVTDA